MPVILSTLIILIAALSGWFLSYLFIRILFRPYSPQEIFRFRLHGIVPAMLPALASKLGYTVKRQFLSDDRIAAKLTDPALLAQLRPDIERNVDEFLSIKLKEAFPLLSNFMGEKTLNKFREAFLSEVETILPELLNKYSKTLLQQWEPEKLLAEMINGLDVREIEITVRAQAGRQIRLFQMAGFVLGAAAGFLQLLLIWLHSTYAVFSF